MVLSHRLRESLPQRLRARRVDRISTGVTTRSGVGLARVNGDFTEASIDGMVREARA
jgi:hypothetical protein